MSQENYINYRSPSLASALISVLAIVVSIAFAGLLAYFAGSTPLEAYRSLLSAGFGCGQVGPCASFTALQFTTPLLLTGLSAAVALRSGVFSVGQAGQMLLGAGGAALVAVRLQAPPLIVIPAAILTGVAFGAIWGGIPGLLKAYLNVNEIIVTLIMNPLASLPLGFLGFFFRVPEPARMGTLVAGTKLNAGLLLALLCAVGVQIWFGRMTTGYENKMSADSEGFSRYGNLNKRRAIVRAMLISGGLAGLAGGIEVLGVHYRFVSAFSGGGGFDGLAVAMLGQLHPLGITLISFFLAGVRVGALNGLQLQARIPRELGDAMIAVMMIVVSSEWVYRKYQPGIEKGLSRFRKFLENVLRVRAPG